MSKGEMMRCELILIVLHAFGTTLIHSKDLHPCDRQCEYPPSPKICEYDFVIEWYYTMSKACYDCPFVADDCSRPHCIPADGINRPLVTVNRQFQGPSIRVCYNDTVRVVVDNQLVDDESVTIHWHGLFMKDTPHMDGVPMITQCGIPSRTTFTYEFLADPPGTHWWHSHSGFQRADGLAGPLIVNRPPDQDPHRDLYDVDSDDYVIFLMDWLHTTTLDRYASSHHNFGLFIGDNVLINGKGVFKEFFNTTANITYSTPRKVFTVEKNKRYKFRMISSAAFCSFEVSIDGHELNVIATDGYDIKPMLVSSIVIHSGESFDFVVDASNEISNYWIRVRGLEICAIFVNDLTQKAILKYQGATEVDIIASPNLTSNVKQLNNQWSNSTDPNNIQITSLMPQHSDLYLDQSRYRDTPDQTHFIGFDIYMNGHPSFNDPKLYPDYKKLLFPKLNNISFVVPKYPMLTQSNNIDNDDLCFPEASDWTQSRSQFCGDEEFCSCTHVIDVGIGNLVELVIYDEGGFPFVDVGHPMHLHGQHFKVVAMKKVGDSLSPELVKELHANGSIEYNFNTVLKDTVIVPNGGYTVVRFLADNPGVWFFHCHLSFHLHIGMSLVFRVGEPSQWIKPPEDFPKCGTWSDSGKSSSGQQAPLPNILLISTIMTPYLFIFYAMC
ncbi:uncharacterized protein LOC120333742 [Styela clava]